MRGNLSARANASAFTFYLNNNNKKILEAIHQVSGNPDSNLTNELNALVDSHINKHKYVNIKGSKATVKGPQGSLIVKLAKIVGLVKK